MEFIVSYQYNEIDSNLKNMTTKMINGVIKNGAIIPYQPLPKNFGKLDVKIYVFPQADLLQKRGIYKGAMPLGWGDPVKYQKKQRKDIDRNN